MKDFFSLEVVNIDKLTQDAVAITFDTSQIQDFEFVPGQYITVRHEINNQDIRRSYSISSIPGDNIEIGVKLVSGGLMSTFLTKTVKKGDKLDIMPPLGSFFLKNEKSNKKHYVGICAGSGITPILSMIRNTLREEPESDFTLIYGNKNRNSIMFFEELQNLESKFQSQFFVHYAFSRENIEGFINGRIDREKLEILFKENCNILNANSFFLCGPGELIDNTTQVLNDHGINNDSIFFERFTSGEVSNNKKAKKEIVSQVTVTVDGDDFDLELSSNGMSILDAAMEEGADVPFSCKGGVCCVCKAKVIEGEVEMDQNFSLSDDEVSSGFILTCQSHPKSDKVVVDFDEI